MQVKKGLVKTRNHCIIVMTSISHVSHVKIKNYLACVCAYVCIFEYNNM